MLFALAASLVVGGANVQGDFRDTPKNHWVFEARSYLKSQGLLIGYPDGLGRGLPIPGQSRYENAVYFHAAATNLQSFLDQLNTLRDRLATEAPDSDLAKRDAAELTEHVTRMRTPLFRKAVAYLAPAQNEFDRELKSLGADPTDFTDPLARYSRTVDTFQIPVVYQFDSPRTLAIISSAVQT